MELFVILVNGFQTLHNVTKSLVLVVDGVQDLSLHFIIVIIIIIITIIIIIIIIIKNIFVTFIITRIFE